MRFRAIDSNNDWILGAGKASYLALNDAIMVNIATTLRTFYTECFFNKEIGVSWFNLINEKNKDIIVLNIKSIIAVCYGVVKISEIEYSYTIDRVLEIKYTINTLYENNVMGTVVI